MKKLVSHAIAFVLGVIVTLAVIHITTGQKIDTNFDKMPTQLK